MINATPLLRLRAKRRQRELQAQDPRVAQTDQLQRLLHRARGTKFGQAHGFDQIRGPEDYRAQVPLRRYEDFWRDWWQDAFPAIGGITWPDDPRYFALSSGTTSGRTKYIPVSAEMLAANTRAGLDLLSWHVLARPQSRVLGGRSLMLGGSTALEPLAGGAAAGDLSGIAAARLPWWARRFQFPPLEVALEPDWDKKLDAIARLAPGADIRALTGTPSWVLALFDRLADHGHGDAKAAFPDLDLVVHGGVAFAPYRARFERWLERSTAELREVYPASEGFIALADADPQAGLRLLVDNGLYFEFVDADRIDDPTAPRLWLGDVQTGVDYALVMTTCAGLWAYVIGDVVRFTSLTPPRVVVAGRVGWSLSTFGEHLIGRELDAAITAAAAAADVEVRDWMVGTHVADANVLGHHVWLVEAPGLGEPDRLARFARTLDQSLAQANDDYRAHRVDRIGIAPPEVVPLADGAVNAWMRARGKLGGQNKVPRVIADTAEFARIRQALAVVR